MTPSQAPGASTPTAGRQARIDELRQRICTALGDRPADLVLRGATVVDVHRGRLVEADIAISGKRIVAVSPNLDLDRLSEMDCRGLYAGPGFVEPHMHIETTFVTPRQLARAIVPLGTTTLFADGTDSSYVGGTKAIRALHDASDNAPLRLFIEAPSYSAFLPELQTVGGPIDVAASEEMVRWPTAASLGEVVAQRIVAGDADYLEKTIVFRDAGKRINGHSMDERPEVLDAFVSVGIVDDHTAWSGESVEARLARGMTLFLVEAPGRRRLADMLAYVVEHQLPTRALCLCIDNISIKEITTDGYGYLDHAMRLAVQSGIPTVEAIQMATLNPAVYFGKDADIGSIAPGRYADIQLWEDLTGFRPKAVLFEGRVVAEDGRMTVDVPRSVFPDWYLDTVRPAPDLTAARMLPVHAGSGSSVKARVIYLGNPHAQAENEERIVTLPVRDGLVWPSLDQDVAGFSVVERYRATGNVGPGFLQGGGLRRGALATSVSISDSNIVVMGCDPVSMLAAVRELTRIHGGFVVVEGERVIAELAAPAGGQMSDEPFEQVAEQFEVLLRAARELGCTLANPFLTMASTVLMSVPDLGLSDCGYIDARTGSVVPTVIG